jgi:uncharacterized protein with HEPN domain
MTRRSDDVLFADMLDSARVAVRHSTGRTRADFDSDELYALAMARLVSVIGEAASRVSEAGRNRAPQIPWQQVIGTRNRLIHAYATVNFDILWGIVSNEPPAMVGELERVLSRGGK